jgi:hypothetical protein
VVAVARAEELAVAETLALQGALRAQLGVELDAVVVNALEPDRFTPREAARLEAHAELEGVAVALAAHRRAGRQRAQVARLARGTGLAPVELGARTDGPDLGALADELGRALV